MTSPHRARNGSRSHLTVLPGGKPDRDERDAYLKLYGQATRVVRAEPKPTPTPPRPAA